MTTQAQQKGFWGLSKPLLMEQALQFSVPMLDTLFLSLVADAAASAAGALAPVLFLSGNILWVTVFAGASIANQRLGAGKVNRAVVSIWIAAGWVLLLASLFALILYFTSPGLIRLMGLGGEVAINAQNYMKIACLLSVVWAAKALCQSVLNMFGLPQWNLVANGIYFTANLLANSAVVFQWFGLPEPSIGGIAWASVIASSSGVILSIFVIRQKLNLRCQWRRLTLHFEDVSRHLFKVAAPSSIEPISFDINMVVLNTLAAKLGTVALAAKVYTFNIYMTGVIISAALTTATQILVTQFIGAGKLDQADRQLKYSLRVALLGTGAVALILLALHHPVMDLFTDDQQLLGGALWWFALSTLTEPGRTTNIMCGQNLRAVGDGWYIAYRGLAFTWLVALPLGYVMAFVLNWGLLGLLACALLDESGRAVIFYRRWQQGYWRRSHIQAKK
ncbi:putative transporter [Saliniradius amylolyticus]|uniref:Putative transporter n=1 Tax=Saliniradius amylolyticus TaxID=2183582 RepID=A0A2S2E6D7_9ALTE|nr:MATE family efflux transporter [Saliniradius amylolyticus]AWL13092.1 putative transporter [Saliniradius amylolyticus]